MVGRGSSREDLQQIVVGHAQDGEAEQQHVEELEGAHAAHAVHELREGHGGGAGGHLRMGVVVDRTMHRDMAAHGGALLQAETKGS